MEEIVGQESSQGTCLYFWNILQNITKPVAFE